MKPTSHCYRCYKPLEKPVIKLQLTRYKTAAPEMYLCNECYFKFQNWIKETPKYPGDPIPNLIQ